MGALRELGKGGNSGGLRVEMTKYVRVQINIFLGLVLEGGRVA